MSIRFSKRLLLLDERSNDFLKTLVLLGSYCTIEQAQKLGLANSARRVVARVEALKQTGAGARYYIFMTVRREDSQEAAAK